MSAFPLPATPSDPQPSSGLPSARRLGVVGVRAPVEIEGFPAALLAELPAPPTIGLHVPGVEGVIRLALDPAAPRDDDEVSFGPAEWAALVRGVEADRIWPEHLRAFCARKRAEPAWRLDAAEALAGAQPDPEQRWGFGRVLARLGATVLSLG